MNVRHELSEAFYRHKMWFHLHFIFLTRFPILISLSTRWMETRCQDCLKNTTDFYCHHHWMVKIIITIWYCDLLKEKREYSARIVHEYMFHMRKFEKANWVATLQRFSDLHKKTSVYFLVCNRPKSTTNVRFILSSSWATNAMEFLRYFRIFVLHLIQHNYHPQ